MDRLERAREFVDHEVFTDGQGRNAGRLVMEFDAKIPGTGWGKLPIADKFVKFAAPYEAALRECHAALSAYQDANRLHNDGEAELYNAADKALESASELLGGGNDGV